MKLGKRMLAWLLSLTLLLSVTPFSVFALTEEEAAEAVTLVCGEEWVLDAAEDNRGKQTFVFVPEESGRYVFYSYDNDYDVYAYLYDSERTEIASNDDGGDNLNFRLASDLTAGKTYYYVAEPYGDPGSGTYCVQVVCEYVVETLVCGEERVLDGEQLFKFVPEEDGRYVFYSYDNDFDVECYLYNSDYDTLARDDEGGYNHNFRLSYDLTAGETYYYRARPYDDPSSGTYCVQVVCEYVAETLVCGEEWVIDGTVNDGEQLFKFVPEEDGRYVFYSYDNDFDVECCLYNSDYDTLASDDDGGDNHNFRLTYDLTAGETYYYRAQPYSSANRGTYCVKLALEAVADGLVILEGDTATRYKYTDSTFHARLTPDGAIPESITWESSDESVATIESDGLAEFYKPGTVTFTATSESGLTDNIVVTVSDGETMDYGYSVSGTLPVREGVLYKLTVPEDGQYTFMVSGEGKKQLNVYNEYGQYVTAFYGDTVNDYNVWLDVEYTYYIVLESREDILQAEYSIYVTPTVEAESVSIRPTYLVGSEMSEIALSVDFLPLGAAPQSVTWKTTDESVAYVNSDILYLDNVGTTLLTVTTEEGLTATLPVEVRSVTQLQAGGQISAMLNYEEYVVFRVDVEAEGYYNFTSSAEYYHEVQVHDANRESVYYTTDSYNEFGVELQPGTYYVRVTNWDYRTVSGGESFFLEMNIVPYIEDVQIALYNHDDDSYEIITDTLVGKEGDDLTLVKVFSPENAREESFAWESSDESVATVDHWGEVHLYAPGTATITVTSDRGVTDSITVTVEALPEITLEEPVVGTLLYGENGETVTFKFVPEEDGVYAVCESGRWYKHISVADRNGYGTSSSGYDVSCQYPMTAGDTYYIRLYNGSGEDREYSLSVKKVPPAESMNIEGGYDAVQIGTRFTLYTTFSPEDAITESVTWESSDETIATVTSGGYVSFYAAGTVTITATSENGLTATREFTVSPAVELVYGDTVSGETDEYGNVTFLLRATEAGTVRVEGRGDSWAEIRMLDAEGWQLNAFGGSALETEHTFYEAGECIYFRVQSYSEDSRWEFTVTPLVPAESITILGGDVTGFVDENHDVDVEFAPENAITESITWESDNESVATVDEWGCIYFHVPGTATITATSENGLTDSITATVKAPALLEAGVEASGTLAYLQADVYQFTLQEDAWCVFSSSFTSDADEGVQQYLRLEDEDGHSYISHCGWSLSEFRLLEGGKTYTVRVQHDDYGYQETVGNYRLVLDVHTLSALDTLSVGQTAEGSLHYKGVHFYAFTPDADGAYRFTAEYANEYDYDTYIELYDADGYELNNRWGNGSMDIRLTADETYYLIVCCRTEDGETYSATVEYLPPAESLTIEGGDFEGYAGEERALQAVFAPENAVHEYVTWHSSDESVAMFDHGSNWLVLRKEGTAVLTATSQNGLTDSITVTVKEPTPLEAGVQASGTLAYLQSDVYQFTLEEDAWCSIISTSVGEEFDQYLRVNDENGYGYVSWSGWAVYPCVLLEGGKTYTVQVKHDDYSQSELVGNYTMVLKVMPLSELPAIGEGEAETGTLPFGVSDVFAFTPEEDGTYKVEMESANYGWNTAVYDATGHNFNNVWGNGSMQVTLTAGETYYLSVCSTSRDGASYNLNVTRLMPAESLIIYADEIEGFVGERLDFEAHFAPEDCVLERVEWTSSNETVATVNAWGEVHLLSAGTAIITATSESGLAASETVTVKAAPSLSLNTTEYGVVSVGETAAYVFTLPADGGYRFTYGGDYKHVIVRNEWGGELVNSWTGNGSVNMRGVAGENYYVYFSGVNEEEDAAYDITVTALVPATGMTIVGGDCTGYVNTSFHPSVQFAPDNAMAESVTWESSDDTVVAITDWGEAYLVNIGTATITATSENGLTDSITVTVKDYEAMSLDTEYVLNNENGNVETVYAFTPAEDGIYMFYSTGDETDPYAALYDADWNWLGEADDNADHNNFRLQRTMTAGETYYLRVSSYTGRVGTYRIAVKKLQLAETMNVHYNFDAPVEGENCYIEVTFGPEGCARESVTWHSSDENVATIDRWGYLLFVGAGTVTITATSERGLTHQQTFTVKGAIPYLGDAEAQGTIAPNDACSYKWTVPEDGSYRITFGGGYKNNAVRYENGGYYNNCWAENWSVFVELEAGDVYYLYMYNNRPAATDYTLSITRPGVAESITIEQDSPLIGYVGDYAGLNVSFYPEDAMPEALTFTSANESVVRIVDGSMMHFVGAGTTVVTVVSENGLRDEIVVRVKAPVPLVPDTETNGTMEAHDMAVYSFVADTTGDYAFTVDSGFYKYCRVYCADNDNITSESGYGPLALQVHLQAGEIYYLRVQNYEEYGDYSVRVKEADAATELVIDQGDTVQGFVSGSLDLSVTFGPEGAREEEITWTSDDPSVVYVSEWGAISLVGEGTATLTVTSESGLTDSITVTVVQPPALTLNTPVNGTMIGYDVPTYRFVPTKDGQYAFVLQKQAYGELVITDANFEHVNGYGDGGEITVQAYLLTGEVYYIHMYQYNVNAQIEFTLKVTDTVPATSMTINDGDTYADFPGSGHRFDVTFGPENAAREEVTWTSSDPDIADIFEDGYAEFYQSGTVVFTATSASGFTDRITVTVLTMAETAEPLTSNRVEIDVNKGITVFSFTPTESGKYAFTSSPIDGAVDPMIRLLDAEDNELARADDELEDMQFRLEYTLTAGETYYLFLRTYEMQDQADSYLLTVERAQTLTDITIVEGDITGDINDEYQLSVSFAPDGALPEGYVFTSANSLVAVVTDDGWLWLRGAGTTTVTVTSDSGLTDTITVTVNGVVEHVYDNACDTDCNLCGEVREVPHAYSSACDATCDLCGDVRVVAAAHTYDNACDAVCNLCGATRTVEHTYSGACDPLCNVCGAPQANAAAHTYDNACDTECNVCGTVRAIVHAYSGDCDVTCNVCGDEREALAEHTHDNACDTSCNVCGEVRVTEHTYAGDCDTVCDVCGDVRTTATAHTYDNDCDTSCNVCDAVREIVHAYSGDCDTNCNVCGEERDALALHTHDNACDTVCNVCGATRTVEHTYAGDCDTVCDVCGATREALGEHEYEDNADTVCDVCGAERDAVHQYSGVCDTTCNLCGEEREVSAQHTYDNACDTNCNICGAVRVTEHEYTAACDVDCGICGFVRTDAAAHTYDNACDTECNVCAASRATVHTYSSACDTSCNVCGEERAVDEQHTYTNACDTSCNFCGATRTTEHIYDAVCDDICNVCDFVRTDAAAHTYENACDTDCNVCGTYRVTVHTYAAPCDRFCDVCGEEREPLDGHTRENLCTPNCALCGEALEVTHDYSGSCDPSCNVCGAVRDDAAQHTYDNVCDTACNVCGAERAVDHVYTAACDTQCNVCGAERAVQQQHSYSNACDASCNLCGATRTPAAHRYDNACDANCNVCGAPRTPSAHVYDNACDASCNVCGATRTPAAHVYDNACDANCNVCGATRTPAAHVYDNACDASCNVCGATRTPAAHVYDNACDANCNVCGATRTPAAHVYDNDRDADCNVCGAVREVETGMIGDVDGNGKIDSTDARLVLQYAVKKVGASALDVDLADVDGNGKVDSTDARLILQYAVKKINAFPKA
ncbi:MAG: hypothetical protein E7549_00125 [Ruminococcaceae bacterium]|nr:hypothetical protein [Oscillospiraceae bacterium]